MNRSGYYILASDKIDYAGKVVETRVQWQTPMKKGLTYVFFQYCNGLMVSRIKMRFKC